MFLCFIIILLRHGFSFFGLGYTGIQCVSPFVRAWSSLYLSGSDTQDFRVPLSFSLYGLVFFLLVHTGFQCVSRFLFIWPSFLGLDAQDFSAFRSFYYVDMELLVGCEIIKLLPTFHQCLSFCGLTLRFGRTVTRLRRL